MGKIKYSIEDCHKLASERNGKCLSDKYVGAKKLKWECSNGHHWDARYSHIKSGTWCSVCHKEDIKSGKYSPRLSIETVKDRLSAFGIEFLEEKYLVASHKYKLKCSNGHIFSDKYLRPIMDGKVGCPSCNNYFKSENNFRRTIEAIFLQPFPKIRPDWLINLETGYKLELDCYNKDLQLAFEYDGQFHYEIRKGINNDLNKTRKLDALKDRLCKEKGIVLIRVPYFLKEEELYHKLMYSIKSIYGSNYYKLFKLHRNITLGAESKVVEQSRLDAAARIVR